MTTNILLRKTECWVDVFAKALAMGVGVGS